MVEAQINYEQMVIEQLKGYKRLVGRIKILERQPIGNGMYLQSANKEDKLQDLHRELKGMPSYMYLSKREQELETVAHAYLTEYPLGTRSQLYEVKSARGVDAEDKKNLKDLGRKIKKVIDARSGTVEGYNGVLQRLSELQELQDEKDVIDQALETLEEYKPFYTQLLQLRYIEGNSVKEVIAILNISSKTFDRWRLQAVEEYAKLVNMTHL